MEFLRNILILTLFILSAAAGTAQEPIAILYGSTTLNGGTTGVDDPSN